jgi:hypothetical protein
MKRILLIISCMVIVLLAEVAGAQETVKWKDKQIEELSKKFFHYSNVDGKESLVLTTQPDDDWYEKAFGDPCENTIVKLVQPCSAISIPESSLILTFLECPASRGYEYGSIVAFFDRKDLEAPLCFSRLALMPDSASYYYGSIESLEAREARKGEFYIVVTLSGADGGDWWSSFAFLRMDLNCKITALSKLDSGYTVTQCNKDCGGDKMEYRFLDNRTVQVTTKEFVFTDEYLEKVLKTTRKQYDLEKLYRNPRLRTLPRKSQSGAQDEDGWTPLKWAAIGGHAEAAREYLDKHVDVDGKDKNGRTPLIWAAERGHIAVVKLLLKRGANVNAKDRDDWTALMGASRDGHTEIVKLLLEEGAAINKTDKNGYTSLMVASHMGHTPVIKLLIEKGADINAKDNSGRTALIIASKNGHAEIVELLKGHGAKE